MTQGLILFAHGARDPRWAAPFEDLAARLRARQPGLPVRLAYLEFIAPTLPAAIDELAAAGCTQVDVLPMFLGVGGHVRRDLPQLLDEARARHPQLAIGLRRAIGEEPAVLQAMAEVALAAGSTPEAT
ncbi:MAG: CbiX/SirB N-terminal domain-containing protein [Rubrivivax sp.]|nr:CbiX/SirB N-terminal domain-containing protein [Rubrivivax sp.]